MIKVDDLKQDAWYDGFMWKDGKQQRVTTMKWDEEYKEFDASLKTPHNSVNIFDGVEGFEPNTKSEEPVEI